MILLMVTLTACGKEEKNELENKMVHEHCTRTGTIDENSSTDLSYEIYYTGDILNKVESTEKVISTSSETLEEYEEAYRKIHEYYKDLENFETKIDKTSNSVTSIMIIDYDHINIQELIDIEGEEDNIFENNVPKLSKWKKLAEKVGMECTQVS